MTDAEYRHSLARRALADTITEIEADAQLADDEKQRQVAEIVLAWLKMFVGSRA